MSTSHLGFGPVPSYRWLIWLMRAVHARAKRAALCFFVVWCPMPAPKITIKACGCKLSITSIAKYTYFYTDFGLVPSCRCTCNHAPMNPIDRKRITELLARAEELALESQNLRVESQNLRVESQNLLTQSQNLWRARSIELARRKVSG